jgi:flagellin
MSNQVRGMSQANRNAQDANNLLATAESGLSDISDILSKMRELSVQAATDTLNDNDRSSIELEFQALKDEITRIANVTEYNGMNVLNGTYQQGDNQAAPSSLFNDQNNTANYDQYQPGTSSPSDPHGRYGPAGVNDNGPGDDIRGHWRLQIGADNDRNNQHEFSVMNATANGLRLNHPTYDFSAHVYNLAEFEAAVRDGNLTGKVYVDGTTGEITFDDDTAGDVLSWDATANSNAGALVANNKVITGIGTDDSDPAVWLVSDAVGDTSTLGDVTTSISNENRYWSGAFDTTVGEHDVNVRDITEARRAVTHLDRAIDQINRERSYVGSEQNKLQFTMSNLSSNIQSIESARSSIEDVDFAAEAADLAKNQILAQSGTAMLAQASAISQNILGLLA